MRIFKGNFIALLILLFFLSTIFCCCLKKFAFASSGQQVEHCHFHAESGNKDFPQEHDSQKQHDCQCLKVLNLSNQSLTEQYILPATCHFDFHPVILEFIQTIFPKSEIYLSFHSPPLLEADSIPIYLKYSVLRI